MENNTMVTNETQANAQVMSTPATPAQPQQAAPVAPNPPVQQIVVQPTQTEEPGWFKRNWKKITLGATAVIATVGSAIVAYRKGKANGVNCGMQTPGYENGYVSPLDPNVE